MRAIILILILLVIAAIVAIASGLINVTQTQPARAPTIETTGNGVAASGGQRPKFEVQTGQIAVGTRDANVRVPAIEVRPRGEQQAQPQQQQQQPAQPQQQPAPPANSQ